MTQTKRNVFEEWVERYQNNPVAFVDEVLGVTPDKWQIKFLMAIAKGNRRVSVRSGHGVGKSTASAWAMLWYFMTRSPVKVVVTAPTSSQLFDAMFAELKRWVLQMPQPLQDLVTVKQDRIVFNAAPDEMFISARTSRAEQPEALQGIHCFRYATVDVLTDSGWKHLEDVTLDDRVLCREEHEESAYFAKPFEVFEREYAGPMYEHHGRFLDFSVTPRHKFEYLHRQCNKLASGNVERWNPFVREVSDMHKGINKIKSTFTLVDQGNDWKEAVIPAYRPKYEREWKEQLEIVVDADDFVEFLAWYLAEGSIGKNKYGPSRVCIAQSKGANPQKYERILSLIRRMGFEPTQGKTEMSINKTQLAECISDMCPGVAHEKRVPEFVFGLSKRQIRIFLDAYRAGDGHGDYVYITSSEGMANDLQRLVLLAGGYATINRRPLKGSAMACGQRKGVRNHDIFRVKEWSRSVGHVTMRGEKLHVVDYSGLVSCLTVPGGMFYVRDRKTSKPFWTHNSDNVMLVADEASGVPEQVFEAAAGSMSGHNAVTLLLGNPTRSSGFFYDTHNRLSSEWVTFRVSCVDSPRVSTEYVEEMKSRYGEESNAYRIRVLGEFPRSDDDTIISMELIEAAKNRDVAPTQYAPMIWGLDVARFGSDSSSLTKRKGNTVTEASRVWRNLDLMQLTGAVVAEYEAQKPEDKPEAIMVDSIGLGAGVVDRLKELGLPAVGINVSESPSFSPNQTYANLKAELWYKCKAWFEKRDCRIPDDPRLIAELATVRYTFSSTGKTRVESKEDIKKRGLKSPDCGDSLILTFAGDAATAIYGSSGSSKSWAKPLRRNVPRLA